MDRLLAVVRREYMETVRTKAFAVSTVLVPLLMGGLMFLPALLAHSKQDERTRLAVVDRTGRLFAELDRELATDPNEDFLKGGQRRYELVDASSPARMPPSDPPGGGNPAKLDHPWAILQALAVDAIVEIRPGAIAGDNDQVFYYSSNVGDFGPIRRVEDALNAVLPPLRLESTGLSREQLEKATRRLDLTSVKVTKEGMAEEREFFQEWSTALFFTIGLYTTTLMAGVALSRGLLEEKASRVVEVLISSVTPLQLMAGKILGHAMVILTQLGIWIVMGAVVSLRGLAGEQAQQVLASVNPWLLGYLVVYFLLGYFLYASLFAAVGAICTTEMEAQQTQTPLVLMQIVPFMLAMLIVRQPGGTMATVLSLIPVFSPSVMMMRLVLQPPPGLQVLASILILAVSVLISFWAVAKIFRVGILMTGKRMTLPEILRWLRAA